MQTSKVGKLNTTVFKEDGWTIVKYYRTDVCKFNDRWIVLDSGGFRTFSTKTRINQTSNQFGLSFQVFSIQFDWVVSLPNGQEVWFEDGLIIDRKTGRLQSKHTAESIADEELKLYVGDVNLSYGGLFVDLSGWKHNYAEVTRFTDLSDAGYPGAVLIERGSLYIAKPQTIKDAIKSCGGIPPTCLDGESRRLFIVESLVWYMGFDVDNSIIIQTDIDGDMSFQGLTSDIRLSDRESIEDWLAVNRGWLT